MAPLTMPYDDDRGSIWAIASKELNMRPTS
jgi:hypothetical protein